MHTQGLANKPRKCHKQKQDPNASGFTYKSSPVTSVIVILLLIVQSRFGDKPLKFYAVCAQNGIAVLNGLKSPRQIEHFTRRTGRWIIYR